MAELLQLLKDFSNSEYLTRNFLRLIAEKIKYSKP